ncbi:MULTISPECIES: GTP-binding protein [unclassified Coleofasciculus]|uniref:GTP-binding protein n=1 Tax=unclassified Coleofasciculus TaxID=2692782 RepID=UPI00187E0833|nr:MULTISPECIES: ATP/GTP-binding protein [unclassified Coleofasciculus]MBE9124597.1 ATP/GTP-binding protein [Coleofasciculus sp. LEGE 07081]MBE9147560.1 ATP/GTP-binding protein [Coleofasciculus sp. LEGE 07092]
MESLRIVVTGTVGAGKSTFVRTASEIDVVEVERRATDKISSFKETTTVAFDFGKLVLGANMDLHIYGTPGQSRFDFMWDILIKGADAYILLVAANQPSGFSYAHEIFSFMKERVQVPMIVGLTHTDCAEALASEEILVALGLVNDKNCPPILTVNPHVKTSVVEALKVLLKLTDKSEVTDKF